VQRPIITCTSTNGIITLSAPPGNAIYAWSTGETTASIQVQESGVYQAWVKHGTGMLGSEPYVIQDLNMACGLSSVLETAKESQTVVGYYDLLGREVAAPVYPNTGRRIYVVRYADGRMKIRSY
jgi:hypothetical protein